MGQTDQVLVEIEPRELKFTFELKKQSSCSVHLVNKSNEYVAFKVKTTSPKRYCVRPNTGVVLPKSTRDFTVTMQAQRTAPPEMQLKDKFLVQTTVVPYGTADEDLLPSFFSKENGRYIEENKLKVVLVSPPDSPILQPINGDVKQESIALKQDPMSLKQESIALKEDPISLKQESTVLKEELISLEQEAIALVQQPVDEIPMVKETPMSNDRALNGVGNHHPFLGTKDVEDLKSKLQSLEVKLNEAEKTIERLREENNLTIQERNKLQQEIVLLRRKCAAGARVGFPFLFVLFMALVGAALGYLLRP